MHLQHAILAGSTEKETLCIGGRGRGMIQVVAWMQGKRRDSRTGAFKMHRFSIAMLKYIAWELLKGVGLLLFNSW